MAVTCPPSHPALEWIESYARFELSLEDLCWKVRDALGKRFIRNSIMRLVNLNQIYSNPAVRITPQHLEILLPSESSLRRRPRHKTCVQAPGGVIAVVDDGGNLMALERLDGTFSAGANISIGKARTAVMFKKPTRFFEELINSSGKGRTVMTALENFTPLIGGIPITVNGQIVGGVGVSGAATADQDEKLAIAGSNAFTPEAGAMGGDPRPEVSYFEKNKVDAAFAKGAVLLDGSDGRNYMVHASRREKPGQAEVHTKDTDVIYVLEGSATLVTGGEAVDANNTAPDELRGSSIRNGQTRQIVKGDVIVVPSGLPHQFLEVTNPFLYYVVKVR